MHHSPGFLKLVDDAKTRVHEITIEQENSFHSFPARSNGPGAMLGDFFAGHRQNARGRPPIINKLTKSIMRHDKGIPMMASIE